MSKKLINLTGISKSYGDHVVLDDLNLYIRENEFITLLGPSGCGKTTLLRDLARQLSAGGGCGSLRVAVVDEREEIAAVYEGVAQNDLGYNLSLIHI